MFQSTLVATATLTEQATLLHATEGFALRLPARLGQPEVEVVGQTNRELVVRLPETEGLWLAFPQDVLATTARTV